MKIESIVINVSRKRIFHTDSNGQREFKLKTKEAEAEFYAYIEQYLEGSSFRLFTILLTPAGWRAILVSDSA
jgi:hypothetical protein